MSKRSFDECTESEDVFHTVKLNGDEFMLILQYDHRVPKYDYSNPGIKLREKKDGTLWEAVRTQEYFEMSYDDMDTLGDADIEYLIRGSKWTAETFKAECGPGKEHKFVEREDAGFYRNIPASFLISKHTYSSIVKGDCVPELIHIEKKTPTEKSSTELTAKFFVTYKHTKKHDEDYNKTCHASIRMMFLRVPEFE